MILQHQPVYPHRHQQPINQHNTQQQRQHIPTQSSTTDQPRQSPIDEKGATDEPISSAPGFIYIYINQPADNEGNIVELLIILLIIALVVAGICFCGIFMIWKHRQENRIKKIKSLSPEVNEYNMNKSNINGGSNAMQ